MATSLQTGEILKKPVEVVKGRISAAELKSLPNPVLERIRKVKTHIRSLKITTIFMQLPLALHLDKINKMHARRVNALALH